MNRILPTLAVLTACGTPSDAPVWHGDVDQIVHTHCASCHVEGDIAPFALETYEQAVGTRAAIAAAVRAGTMPPWKPGPDCNDYEADISLSDEDKARLLSWIDADTPEGDPSNAHVHSEPSETQEPDLLLQLPEPYQPVAEPDDYRCQLIPWPLDEPTYVTRLQVRPDQQAIVHHTIVFAIGPSQVARYQAMDDAEEGPGYTCFGGPNAARTGSPLTDLSPQEILEGMQSGETPEIQSGTQWLGSWVPGLDTELPIADSGILVEPGSMLVVQMHYNTLSSAPVADQSSLAFDLADEVDKPGFMLPLTDLGWVTNMAMLGDPMLIPAGEADVQHATSLDADSMLFARARRALGVDETDDLVIHRAAQHMHTLGTSGRMAVRHRDGTDTCLLEIPDWDFSWQGAYTLKQPVVLGPEDVFDMSCTWDNTAANQVFIDGQQIAPQDVVWGEGTTDEMCLGILYVTAK